MSDLMSVHRLPKLCSLTAYSTKLENNFHDLASSNLIGCLYAISASEDTLLVLTSHQEKSHD